MLSLLALGVRASACMAMPWDPAVLLFSCRCSGPPPAPTLLLNPAPCCFQLADSGTHAHTCAHAEVL